MRRRLKHVGSKINTMNKLIVSLCFLMAGCVGNTAAPTPEEGDVYEELLTQERFRIGSLPGSTATEITDLYRYIERSMIEDGLRADKYHFVTYSDSAESAVILIDRYNNPRRIISLEQLSQQYRRVTP